MTKEARETDISDNLSWLEELKSQIDLKFGNLEAYILGFSQGGATAARWMSKTKHEFKGICLWACVFPPDLEVSSSPLSIPNKIFVIGSEDEFYDKKQQVELATYYKTNDYQVINYFGAHDIDSEVLKTIYLSSKK
jgi:predicted esterase